MCWSRPSPRRARYATQVTLSVTGLLAAFGALAQVYRDTTAGRTAAVGAVVIDRPGLFLQGAILLIGVLGVLLIGERRNGFDSGAEGAGRFHPAGFGEPRQPHRSRGHQGAQRPDRGVPADHVRRRRHDDLPAAGDLLTMFIALEVLSLPLYLMCGLARYRRLQSQEASLKYFLLGLSPRRSSSTAWHCCTDMQEPSVSPASPRRCAREATAIPWR